jgi:streptomycin 6-kinase
MPPTGEGWAVPEQLVANCSRTAEGRKWLSGLPTLVRALVDRWSLEVEALDGSVDATASWVAPVRLPTGQPAVLKIGMPHMEAEHESDGLRYWDGDPTVYLLDADKELNAMLLEQCTPGTSLRAEPEVRQDKVIAELLRRLWVPLERSDPFRPLSSMLSAWAEETQAQRKEWPDEGLVRDGLDLFRDLGAEGSPTVLLATDLHAGNVLRAEREPWLVIDPKPFVGDPAYDATQHLLNCPERLLADPMGTIEHFAGLLEVDPERVRLWMLARTAAEPRDDWAGGQRWMLTKALTY